MYTSKNKGTTVPSDHMAREKLIGYVYEYLVLSGANKAADFFLKEIHCDRINQIQPIGDAPGFLFSWWSVFWDLYSSAPERRNHNPHSDEAKAFHDYNFVNGQQNNGQMYINGMQHNSNAPSPLGMVPGNEGGMPTGGPMPGGPGFFPNSHMRPSPTQPVNQPSPHSQIMQNQQFMAPRYPNVPNPRGGPNVRLPQEFNPPTGVPGQPMMPGNMDPNRQGDGDFVWQGPPSMQPRMAGPHGPAARGVPMGQMNNMGQFPSTMRPPNGQQPNGQQTMPINMPPNGPGRQWANNNQMNYNSPSPGNHYCPPVSNSGPGPTPGTPGPHGGAIMPSPQGSAPYSPANHRMGTPNTGRGEYNINEVDIYDYQS